MNENSIEKRRLQLGEAIRAFRKKEKLSQETLATMVGTKPNAIYRVEHGITNTGINMIMKIADALNVETKDLIDF